MEYRIKEILQEQGLTLKDLAQMIGVDPSNLSSSLKNSGNPSVSRLEKIADALQVNMYELFVSKHTLYGYLEVLGQPKKVSEIDDLVNILWAVMNNQLQKSPDSFKDLPFSKEETDAFINYYNVLSKGRRINYKKLILLTGLLYLNNISFA